MMSCYELPPVDWWQGCVGFDAYLESLTDRNQRREARELLATAEMLAAEEGWEGDVTEGPYIFALPPADGYNTFSVGVAWKQDNNGTTYVVSPQPLPWLEVG